MSTENRDARRRRRGPTSGEEEHMGVLTDGSPGLAIAGSTNDGGVRE